MRLVWGNDLWKDCAKEYGLKKGQTLAVNTIITQIQQAVGVHAKKETTMDGRALPFNYYDTSLLVVNETAHLRIIGIMGTIYNNLIKLIPKWHRKERMHFFENTEKSRGFSNFMNLTHDLEGKDPRCSRKAVKIWASCLQLLGDAKIYGINGELVEFLRMQMMLLGRWFSPCFSLYGSKKT